MEACYPIIQKKSASSRRIEAVIYGNVGTFHTNTNLVRVCPSKHHRTKLSQAEGLMASSMLMDELESERFIEGKYQCIPKTRSKFQAHSEYVLPTSSRQHIAHVQRQTDNCDVSKDRISCPSYSDDSARDMWDWKDVCVVVEEREQRKYADLGKSFKNAYGVYDNEVPGSKRVLDESQVIDMITDFLEATIHKIEMQECTQKLDSTYVKRRQELPEFEFDESELNLENDETPHQVALKYEEMNIESYKGCSQHASPMYQNKGSFEHSFKTTVKCSTLQKSSSAG